ncbi:hypothetical protein FB1_18070 [Flavobacterium branchiophilum NBRC 15030 = ATCC 35035]|nr:hypothetical protein FB1_18070 [Flavobacterium branchiophilum NBRC 15030 = ATCC 35035]
MGKYFTIWENIFTFEENIKNMILEKILKKIIIERNRKGFSYENMANELGITVSGYRKIETGDTKLTVERLNKISSILEISLTELLGLDKDVLNQHNHDNEKVFQQKIDNYYQDNKDVYEKLIQAKDEQISFLKSLISQKDILIDKLEQNHKS